MVKIVDCDEDGAVSAGAVSAGAKVLRNVGVGPQPDPAHASVTVEEEGQPNWSSSNLRSEFICMGFPPMMVDKMLHKYGEHDSNNILESLLSHSAHPNSGSESSSSLGSLFDSDNEETSPPLVSTVESNEDMKPEANSLSERRSYLLAAMKFSQEEVDLAFSQLGEEAPLDELVECILTAQGACFSEGNGNGHATNEVKTESGFVGETKNVYGASHCRLRFYDDDAENKRFKKVKHVSDDGGASSSSRAVNDPWLCSRVGSLSKGSEGNQIAPCSHANIRGDLAKPPYFFYGNIVDISKATWGELSGFLFSVQPEFVNIQSFSALKRKEGYIHNLPRERRRVVGSNSRMTTEDAVPIFTIEDPSMQPHQLEQLLGYPSGHTDMLGLNTQERIAAMRCGFQTDTVAYLLSPLKAMYPDGLRILSIYSGVGGAEVALHRLGLPLKCVVSVEESMDNRKILKRWWGKTKQAGQLRQLDSIKKLRTCLLQELMDEFGGFDLVVGGTYSPWRGKKTCSATMGIDCQQFFEYTRVVKLVRSLDRLK